LPVIGNRLRNAAFEGKHGLAGGTNVQREDQKKLDVVADEPFARFRENTSFSFKAGLRFRLGRLAIFAPSYRQRCRIGSEKPADPPVQISRITSPGPT